MYKLSDYKLTIYVHLEVESEFSINRLYMHFTKQQKTTNSLANEAAKTTRSAHKGMTQFCNKKSCEVGWSGTQVLDGCSAQQPIGICLLNKSTVKQSLKILYYCLNQQAVIRMNRS